MLTECECGQRLEAPDEQAGQFVICPMCRRKLNLPSKPTDTAWRCGNHIVLLRGVAPPEHCFRCSKDSKCKPTSRQLAWNPFSNRFELETGISILHPFSWFFWGGFGDFGGSTRVSLRLCPSCSRSRGQMRIGCHVARLLGILIIVLGVWNVGVMSDAAFVFICVVGFLLVLGAKYFVDSVEPINFAWATDEHVWLDGLSPELLLALPEWREETGVNLKS